MGCDVGVCVLLVRSRGRKESAKTEIIRVPGGLDERQNTSSRIIHFFCEQLWVNIGIAAFVEGARCSLELASQAVQQPLFIRVVRSVLAKLGEV